jgi:Trk K+ transport system NAD-binding subunit
MSMNRAQLRQRSLSDFSLRKKQGLGGQVYTAVSDVLSRAFHTDKTRSIIVGVNPTTSLLANELQNLGYRVLLVSLEGEAEPDQETVGYDEIVLTRAGAQSARCLLAASADDNRNLRVCRTAIDRIHVPIVIARLQMLDGITSWTRVNDAGMSRISWNGLIQAFVPEMPLSPALSRVAKADDREQITEIEVRLPTLAGRAIADLPLEACDALALTRNGASISTNIDTVVEMGDVLTLIGMKTALNKVQASFASL